jgi:hypothetical protein
MLGVIKSLVSSWWYGKEVRELKQQQFESIQERYAVLQYTGLYYK